MNEELPTLVPWYRGYTGQISLVTKTSKTGKVRYGFKSTGSFSFTESGSILVTEIPLFVWTKTYYSWLNELITEKKLVRVNNHSTDVRACFELIGFSERPTLKNLKLERSYSMANMSMLDTNGVPYKFNTINDALEAFYIYRLDGYRERKAVMLKEMEAKIKQLEEKQRYIIDVITGKLIVFSRPKIAVLNDMAQLGHNEKLINTKTYEYTTDEIDSLSNKIYVEKTKWDELNKLESKYIWLHELNNFVHEYYKHYSE